MLPQEVFDAVFPSSARVGETRLESMTLLHTVAMEALGIEVCDRNYNSTQKSSIALWLLSQPAANMRSVIRDTEIDSIGDFQRWVKNNPEATGENAVSVFDNILRTTFATFVPAKQEAGKIRMDNLGEGYGWPIEIAEAVAHEHSRPFAEIMKMPLVTIFALICVMRQRNGGETGGPDYYDRIRIRIMKERIAATRKAENAQSTENSPPQ